MGKSGVAILGLMLFVPFFYFIFLGMNYGRQVAFLNLEMFTGFHLVGLHPSHYFALLMDISAKTKKI